ncbi:hypothetical protein F5879DRAFT_994338 [Lentinula edodes]|nr:hypothetical protein F5879DRAFT_994338 [Lentinula edodes]KAJ3911850.1 hypothetical protein F5877DRAFT_85476 [Lentinula edodes]
MKIQYSDVSLSHFMKDNRNDIPLEFVPNISQSIRDLLAIEVLIPEPDEIEVDLLADAKKLSLSFVKPLMDDLSCALRGSASSYIKEFASGGSGLEGSEIVPVAQLHHLMMALGSIAQGFPDYPFPLPDDYILPPVDVFTKIAQAILTRFAFARILATAGPHVTQFIPLLMGNLLIHFELDTSDLTQATREGEGP